MEQITKNLPVILVSTLALGLFIIAFAQGRKLKNLYTEVNGYKYQITEYEGLQANYQEISTERDSLRLFNEELNKALYNCQFQLDLLNTYSSQEDVWGE